MDISKWLIILSLIGLSAKGIFSDVGHSQTKEIRRASSPHVYLPGCSVTQGKIPLL